METAEQIVESYMRHIKGCATIPNIRCANQHEIDLLAINPADDTRYHIETSVHINAAFSKLTNKPFSVDDVKQRVKGPQQRRTIGFFIQVKFGAKDILDKLAEYGFKDGNYQKVIVSWGCDEDAEREAKAHGIEVKHLQDLIDEIANRFKTSKSHYMDDTVRTIQLASMIAKKPRMSPKEMASTAGGLDVVLPLA